MQPLSRNERPDLRTSFMSLVLQLPREMQLWRSSSNAPRLPSFLEMLQNPHVLTRCTILCACHAKRHLNLQKWREHVVFCTFWLRNVLRATTACIFSTSQLPKVVRPWCAWYILTWKCASRHNGVHFFDISASKSGPRMVWFVHFDFEMCFAPQRRAIPAALASLLFDPPEPQIIGKTQCFATFLPFRASASSFFLLFLFYSSFF